MTIEATSLKKTRRAGYRAYNPSHACRKGMNIMLSISKLRCEGRERPLGINRSNPVFSWILHSDKKNILQSARQIQVTEAPYDCAAADDLFLAPLWDSGKAAGGKSVQVPYEGPALKPQTRYYWRVKVFDNTGGESSWSNPEWFETALGEGYAWKADFISAQPNDNPEFSSESPLFRKAFHVKEGLVRARLYASAHGMYAVSLNGGPVDQDLLKPGWTAYQKRLQYQTSDVTKLLKTGENALGAMLGNGWYKGYLAGWLESNREKYGKRTALILELHLSYKDGSQEIIKTDSSWKTASGPILSSELYDGELYDARLLKEDWDKPGFDETGWGPVYIAERDKSTLLPQENVPVRTREVLKPVELIRTPEGDTVLDFGQNMVGFVRFAVEGPEGSRVELHHAEILDKDGNFYTENLRSAKQHIVYILKGRGKETYSPTFTFQGFRYIRIAKWPGEPDPSAFEGVVIHSDMEDTGHFDCSDEQVNQLQHNILWGQKGNFVDVPTDCPQRDERLGWTGDAQVFAGTALFNMNAAPFFKKWLRDMAADQTADGRVPHVVPHVLGTGDYAACGWADAAVICPWTVYLTSGDEEILKEQYDSMKAWVEYIRSVAKDGVYWNTGFHFGDWLALDAKEGSYLGATPNDLCATAYYGYSTQLLAKTARIIGKDEDAKAYEALYENIRTAFSEEFFTPAGRLSVPTQTAHVLALMFGLVPEKHIQRTADTLVRYLEENKWHLSTGFLGTPYLCHVLSSNGRADAAYKLLLQPEYPSWLYPLSKGATTIWEHWDGIKPDGSLWSKDMNSYNHYAYGAVGDWLYRVVAGLNPQEDGPGYKKIRFQPIPGGGLTWAEARFQSVYGTVETKWELDEDLTSPSLTLSLTVPCNTESVLILPPCADSASLNASGKLQLTDTLTGTTYPVKSDKSGLSVVLGSGSYRFKVPVLPS